MKKPSERIIELQREIQKQVTEKMIKGETQNDFPIMSYAPHEIQMAAIVEFLDQKFAPTFELLPPEQAPKYIAGWNDCQKKFQEGMEEILVKDALSDSIKSMGTVIKIKALIEGLKK